MSQFTMRTSIFGRRLGLSSTGGILAGSSGSTEFASVAQMWGKSHCTTVSSGGASIVNSGCTIISTDSTSGMAALVIAPPVAGIHKEIHNVSSASALTLETSATTILFVIGTSSTLGTNIGSTILTWAGTNLKGTSIVLRGLSTTLWGVIGADKALVST